MAAERKFMRSVNPATGEELARYAQHDEGEVEMRLALSERTFARWRATPVGARAERMRAAAEALDARRDALAELMTREMGKPIEAARAEVDKCAWVCRFYAEHAEAMLADEPRETDARRSFVRYRPLGPVLAVMPWNFPLWQVFRFAAPGLMAGNVGLLKHASNVPGCAVAIEEIFRAAGFPEGAFQALLVGSERVAALIADVRVRAVTLTGSEGAGQSVGAEAGRALKKSVLELGGSDPFIVLPSADLDAAAETAVRSRTLNNGQSCIAAKRFIVHEAVADAFEQRFVAAMEALRVGDPLDPGIEIGPLATAAIRDEVHDQVRRTFEAGARVLTGGQPLEGPGWFYPPTVLTDIPEGSAAWEEEVFGPVAALFRVGSLDEAIALANASKYGLGSAAWTRDEQEQGRLVDELEAGAVFINGLVKSDPRMPFGGVKRSGYGRELDRHGLLEFTNATTVWIG